MKGQRSWLEGKERVVKGSWFEDGRGSASSGAVWRREVERRQRESRVVFVWRPRVAGRTLCFSPPSPSLVLALSFSSPFSSSRLLLRLSTHSLLPRVVYPFCPPP